MNGMKKNLDLSGEWICKLDQNDLGITEQWYLKSFTGDCVLMPGTLAENHIGEKYEPEEGLSKENIRCLRARYQYIGAAWYQKKFELEEEVALGELQLFFERIMFQSKVWVNGIYCGSNDSLSVPHIFQMPNEEKKCKTLIITLRIDNRDIQKIGPYSSAYTDETQTIWNGIVGKMYLYQKEAFEIVKYNISVDAKMHMGFFDIEAASTKELKGYRITIIEEDRVLQTYEGIVEEIDRNYRIKLQMPLIKQILLWNEFHPYCYQITTQIMDKDEKEIISDTRITGFCQMETKGKDIQVNGVPTFLRGNIDCCLYPLTGYPPMEKNMWYKVMSTTKAYGLNHIRFHSWCPPEAAFEVADELGVYLQIEGPVWMDNWMEIEVGSFPEQYEYLPEEARRIITNYSYHPSFCIFSNGNELNGDFMLLEDVITEVKKINPYLICTLSTNWDRELGKGDDIFIAQSVDDIGIRGQYFLEDMVNTTSLNYDVGTANREVPVLSHEVGQYVVYPNVNEIEKYKGNLAAVNLETIRADLQQKNLDKYVPEFVYCSGRLAYELYKAEFEAALNTKDLSGVQILGLHDFPGQSTATIGLLDVFFDSKGITSEEEFRQFCNAEVLLLQLEKKMFSNKEKVNAQLNIANYQEREGWNSKVKLTVKNETGGLLYEETIDIDKLKIGLNKIGRVLHDLDISKLNGRQKLKIEAEMIEEKIHNEWYIWVYEEPCKSVGVYEEWSDELIGRLEAGEKVVLIPKPGQIKKLATSKYFPVFWSPVHFMSKDPCGMMLDDEHPFFTKYYQCGKNADYEWKVFMENAYTVNLDALDDLDPMTMLVPNFYNNHKSSALFEVGVGPGKLLVCGYDFAGNPKTYQTEYLKAAIETYVDSEDFNPSFQCDQTILRKLFKTEDNTEETYNNLALQKNAFADSEKSSANSAAKGNDGNSTSCWVAADNNKGHYWQVDLGNVYNICSTRVEFNEKGRYLYVIQVSKNGEDWYAVVNRTGTVTEVEDSVDEFEAEARYVRIVYNDVSNGIRAGHRNFCVHEMSNISK